MRCQAESGKNQGQDSGGWSLAIVSYDEKPGIQAIATTAPDRPPLPGVSPTVMRDHEYKCHGTLTLMAGIDRLTGHVHALIKERHRSREFIEFLKLLGRAYPGRPRDRGHSRQPFRPCLARDHELACRAAYWPLYVHVHADAGVMAQSHRGFLLQAGAFAAAPHPRGFQTRTQGTPTGLHQRHQSRASRPYLALQNRRRCLIPIGTLFWKRHTMQWLCGKNQVLGTFYIPETLVRSIVFSRLRLRRIGLSPAGAITSMSGKCRPRPPARTSRPGSADRDLQSIEPSRRRRILVPVEIGRASRDLLFGSHTARHQELTVGSGTRTAWVADRRQPSVSQASAG